MSKKINRQLEVEGQKWFAQMHGYISEKEYDSFNRCMQEAENDYRIEYEILGCIGALLTERKVPTEINPVNPQVVTNIRITNQNPLGYRITTGFGEIDFFRLSEALRFTNDGIPNNQRQGSCHEKSFEIASHIGNNARLVTALVSILSEKHTFLHSWVENDEAECAFDYVINVGIGIHYYRELMHAQPPLLEIACKDIKNGIISYNEWGKMIHALYETGGGV